MQADETTRVTSLYQAIFFSIAALVFILAIGAAFFIAFPISQRISALTEKTKLLADGDLNAKVHVKGKDQIAFLMTQFNTMVDDVRTAQESKAYIERMQAWQEVARRLAHEIKNPLTPIVLAVQQLDKKFDDYIDRPQKYRKLLTDAVEIVNEETGTLHKLVKNFSEFARMPIPEKKDTCLYEFVRQTVEQNPQFAELAKRITIHEAAENAAHAHIDIDHELMRRVLVNIIRNGIEAAQNAQFEPEIDIEVSHLENDAHHQLNIRILDNGPGLTDEQKAKLFMPYFTTKSDGTGLGLPIVRKIIEDHDGRIHLGNREDGQRGTQADISL
jgi:nitrogen fixation/metabolism regulation signal transduction histidine kinase